MKKATPIFRVCVLAGRTPYHQLPPTKRCESNVRGHKHTNSDIAGAMVETGQAEWVFTEEPTRKGVRQKRQNAIRLVPRKDWKGKVSRDPDGRGPVKVMQLVG